MNNFVNKSMLQFSTERFPHKPYIKEGFPKNVTVLAGDLAVLQCPTLSDLEPYIQWLKVNFSQINDSLSVPQGMIVQVATQSQKSPHPVAALISHFGVVHISFK